VLVFKGCRLLWCVHLKFYLGCCYVASRFERFSNRFSICCDAFPVGDETAVAIGTCVDSWLRGDVCCLLLLKMFSRLWIWLERSGSWQFVVGWCVVQGVHGGLVVWWVGSRSLWQRGSRETCVQLFLRCQGTKDSPVCFVSSNGGAAEAWLSCYVVFSRRCRRLCSV
jgi:hypothetical protein